jgi:hypothetical protein
MTRCEERQARGRGLLVNFCRSFPPALRGSWGEQSQVKERPSFSWTPNPHPQLLRARRARFFLRCWRSPNVGVQQPPQPLLTRRALTPTPTRLEPSEQLFQLHVKSLRLLVNLNDKLFRLVRLFLSFLDRFELRSSTARRLIHTRALNFHRAFNALAIRKTERYTPTHAHSFTSQAWIRSR